MRKSRFYTLVELLTVIFVIAVLAGLIIPGTALVRSRAKRTSCSSNLKQVGLLAMQFSNDRQGLLLKYEGNKVPTLRSKNVEKYARNNMQYSKTELNAKSGVAEADGKKDLWTASLIRYAKYDMGVFHCTADERNLDVFSKAADASYGLNYGAAEMPGSVSSAAANKMSSVTRSPAAVIYIGEFVNAKLGMDTSSNNNVWTPAGHTPHSNYFNISFLDGHVDGLSRNELTERLEKNHHKIK